MNLKKAKALRRQALASTEGLKPATYVLDTRKYKVVPRPGTYLPQWQHGPVRPPHVIFTRMVAFGTTRAHYKHLKRIGG